MAQDYYTILTNAGLAYEAQQKAQNKPITLTHYGICDGNGAIYNPDPAMTALRREVTPRRPLNALQQDPNNPTWLVAEGLLPDDVGGWTIRALGIYTDTGILYAVAKCPESVKPLLASGSGKQFYVRVIFQTSNAASVTLLVDNSVVMAPRSFVIDHVRDELAKRDHKQSVRVATVAPIILSGEQSIDGVAVVSGDRVLVKDQASAIFNGIYVVASGVWTRATDADSGAKLNPGATVPVEGGAVNADTQWTLKTDGQVTIGTSALLFQWAGGLNVPDQLESDSSSKAANTAFVSRAVARIAAGYMFEIQPWLGSLEAMPKGFFPLSGVHVSELEVPGLRQAIVDTNQPYCYAADRVDPLKAGMWGLGDGYVITPDWNGASANSIGGLYFGGDLGGQRRGVVVGDAIREIAAKVVSNDNTAYQFFGEGPFREVSGAFEVEYKTGASITDSANHTAAVSALSFKASKVHPVASEVRPKTIYGTWMIRLYGHITNVGSLDAAALVAAVNALKSRIEVVEARVTALEAKPTKRKPRDVLSVRAVGVNYANNTPDDIEVNISGGAAVAQATAILIVDEVEFIGSSQATVGLNLSVTATVPPGLSYRVPPGVFSTIYRWKETRQ